MHQFHGAISFKILGLLYKEESKSFDNNFSILLVGMTYKDFHQLGEVIKSSWTCRLYPSFNLLHAELCPQLSRFNICPKPQPGHSCFKKLMTKVVQTPSSKYLSGAPTGPLNGGHSCPCSEVWNLVR